MINYNGKKFEFNTKIKVVSGIFKGIKGELIGVNENNEIALSHSEKLRMKAKIKVDVDNSILVDFNDIENLEKTYIIYAREYDNVTKIIGIKTLLIDEVEQYIRKIYTNIFGDIDWNKFITARPIDELELKLDNIKLDKNLSECIINKLL